MNQGGLAKALYLSQFDPCREIVLRFKERENIVGHVQQIAQPSSATQSSNRLGDVTLRRSFSSINTWAVRDVQSSACSRGTVISAGCSLHEADFSLKRFHRGADSAFQFFKNAAENDYEHSSRTTTIR
jgi:hypothetical protein